VPSLPRSHCVQRLRPLGRLNTKTTELKTFRAVALSRLAAQHDETTALRAELQASQDGRVRMLSAHWSWRAPRRAPAATA